MVLGCFRPFNRGFSLAALGVDARVLATPTLSLLVIGGGGAFGDEVRNDDEGEDNLDESSRVNSSKSRFRLVPLIGGNSAVAGEDKLIVACTRLFGCIIGGGGPVRINRDLNVPSVASTALRSLMVSRATGSLSRVWL